MYVMCMLSKINLKKENISADLVIWIINIQTISRDVSNRVCFIFYFKHDLSYRMHLVHYIYVLS